LHHHALVFFLLFATAPSPKPLNGYAELVVANVSAEKSCEFSRAQFDLLRKSLVSKLRGKKTYVVIDSASPEGAEAVKTPPAQNVRRVTVDSVVIAFDAGSRAARTFGIGAGATKLRVRFTFKDAANGLQILTLERIGKYSGRFNGEGASNDAAFVASCTEVIDGLVQEIEKNR